jgi:hypothetical protein
MVGMNHHQMAWLSMFAETKETNGEMYGECDQKVSGRRL